MILGHGQTNPRGKPSKLHPILLQSDVLKYAEVKNTANLNHDKKGILTDEDKEFFRNDKLLALDSPNIHAKKCFKDHYPSANELANPNKYSSVISILFQEGFCPAGLIFNERRILFSPLKYINFILLVNLNFFFKNASFEIIFDTIIAVFTNFEVGVKISHRF